MKKLIALALCLMAAALVLCGCAGNGEEESAGNIIPVYLGTEIYDFDPATAYLDDATTSYLGLLYEGLFRINEKGKVEKAMADSVRILDDDAKNSDDDPANDVYGIEITIKNTAWSDGTVVQAADYVYAFKRILDPEFHSEAAAMLFDIKNARLVKSGDLSPDDLGMTDEASNVIRFLFETKIDYDQFYEYLASPRLVPLRQDKVETEPENWATNVSIIVTNGPFVVRTFNVGRSLVLERNVYYYRNVEKDAKSKYVEPYRLVINFGRTQAENFASTVNDEYALDADIDLEGRKANKDAKSIEKLDTLSTLSLVMNTTDRTLKDAKVREALSLAIDRQKIVDEIMIFAKPAGGVITDNVFEAGSGKTFREEGGSVIASEAKLNEAKALLAEAGVKGGSLEITLRKGRDLDRAVAIKISEAWGSLGFDVELKELGTESYTSVKQYLLCSDLYEKAYYEGKFQIIMIDFTMMTTDAFPTLAQFAKDFSGGTVDFSSETYDVAPHVSGYTSDEYNDLITKAFEIKDRKERAKLLHEAENMLVKDAPIIPIAQYQKGYIKNGSLSKITTDYWGVINFKKAKLGNAEKYLETVPLVTEIYEA